MQWLWSSLRNRELRAAHHRDFSGALGTKTSTSAPEAADLAHKEVDAQRGRKHVEVAVMGEPLASEVREVLCTAAVNARCAAACYVAPATDPAAVLHDE